LRPVWATKQECFLKTTTTTNFLEKKIRENLCELGLTKEFLDKTPKHDIKQIMGKVNVIIIKDLLCERH
jgi:hypothetical protein